MGARRLADAVAVDFVREEAETGRTLWRGQLSDAFNVMAVPNGGYVTAVLVHALKAAQIRAGDANVDILKLSARFLGSTNAGAAFTVAVHPVRRGRRTTWLDASFEQAGKPKVAVSALFGRYGEGEATKLRAGAARVYSHPDLGPLPRRDSSALLDPFELGSRSHTEAARNKRPIFSRMRWKMPPRDAKAYLRMLSDPSASSAPSPTSFRAYVSLEAEDEAVTTEALALIADGNVPVVKASQPLGDASWVPTLSLDLDFFAAPNQAAPVLALWDLHSVGPGFLIETCELLDADSGALLCSSRQLAMRGVQQAKI